MSEDAHLTGDVDEPGAPERGLPTGLRVVAAVVCLVLVGVVLATRLGSDADGETDADGPATSTTAPGAPSPFTLEEVAEEIGIDHVQGELRTSPDCLFGADDALAPVGDQLPPDIYHCETERSAGGVAVGDFDADGDQDLYFTRVRASGVLYENDGSGRFTDVTAELGLDGGPVNGNGAGWADLENDGFPDLYVTTVAEGRFFLFMNDGSGPFTEEAETRGAALADDHPRGGFGVAFGDVDNDGWVDLHTTEWLTPDRFDGSPSHHSRLLRNRGPSAPGTFEDVTVAAGVELADVPDLRGELIPAGTTPRNAFASTFVDLDGDGWQDLLVASDFGTVRLFWNDGDGTFTDGTDATPFARVSNAMGSTFGDVDGDGDLDWFTTSIGFLDACEPPRCVSPYSGNALFRNDGDRTFTDVTEGSGLVDAEWGWGAALVDLDNDRDLDVVATNGQASAFDEPPEKDFSGTPDRVWAAAGDGTFVDVAADAGLGPDGDGKGLAVADLDGDGTQDLVIVDNAARPRVFLARPRRPAHWLRVVVRGGPSGTEARGAVVTVTSPDGVRQVRHVGVGAHLLGQGELAAHVGLGSDDGPVEVTVDFPATGRSVTVRDVAVDATVVVDEPLPGGS